jgi:hypothetical protein
MKINKTALVEAPCSTDATRHGLGQPYLSIEDKAVISTDGRCMAVVPVEVEEGDVSGWLSAEALKAARKLGFKTASASVHCNGALALDNGASFPRPFVPKEGETPSNYPNWKAVTVPAGKNRHLLTFDVNLLVKLSKALGTPCLKLEIDFEPDSKVECEENADTVKMMAWTAIRVSPGMSKEHPGIEGSYGVLMPMK